MKVIFVDIDGVLVTSRHWVQSKQYFGHEFDPVCAASLREIIVVTGAQLIISSSWREGRTLQQLQSIFEINGIVGVRGMTPVLEGATRGKEIEHYLTAVRGTDDEVSRFVILDDEEEMGALEKFLIKTEFHDGLNASVKEIALKRLTSP